MEVKILFDNANDTIADRMKKLAIEATLLLSSSLDNISGAPSVTLDFAEWKPTEDTAWATMSAAWTDEGYGRYRPTVATAGGMVSSMLTYTGLDFHIGSTASTNPVDFAIMIEDGVAANVIKIDEDSDAAVALKKQYNGVGNVGDNFPSTQEQIGQLSTGSGSVSKVASSVVVTVGTPSGAYTDTFQLDGALYAVAAAAAEIDFYLEYLLGSGNTGGQVGFDGFANTVNDNIEVYAWDWAGTTYRQIGTIVGGIGTVVLPQSFTLDTRYTGTGSDAGKVRIRFHSDGADVATSISIDRLLCEYSNTSQSVGYANGAIWVDTNAASSGSGKADEPVNTWADALAYSASTGLKNFQIAGGSSITLTGDSTAFSILGTGSWALNLGGQQINNALFSLADIQGIGTISAPGNTAHFVDCDISLFAVTTLGESHLVRCGLGPYLTTLATTGDYSMISCYSNVAGDDQPPLSFGTGHTIELGVRGYPGSIRFMDLEADHTVSFDSSAGRAIADSSGIGGTLKISYPATSVDESSGAVNMIYIRPDALHTGKLRSGGNGKNIVQLAADAPAGASGFDGSIVHFSKGLINQYAIGIEYDVGGTRILALRENLKTTVDTTWRYEVLPGGVRSVVNNGILLGGSTTVVRINALANQTTNSYKDQTLRITATPAATSANEDQCRLVTSSAFTGGYNELTLDRALPIAPDTESSYELEMDQRSTNLNVSEIGGENVSVVPELTGMPSATASLVKQIKLLFMDLLNKNTTTNSARTIRNDAGDVIGTAAITDDTVTGTKGKFQ